MPRDALTRAENETTSAPASTVFPGEAPAAPYGAPPAPAPAFNPYAPPVDDGGGSTDWIPMNQGSFGTGFAFGFFCGCIALIVSYTSSSMGSETKRGVRYGFVTGMAIGILVRVLAAAAR